MRIQCDACDDGEAAVFCTADEAAICPACDSRVHHANKLAEKHLRYALHRPPAKQAPVCDICQERKAFLFCQQDRAILCRECDGSIHRVNEHTQKHTRFLLTGVKVSPTPSIYSPESDSKVSTAQNSKLVNSPVSAIPPKCAPSPAKGTTPGNTAIQPMSDTSSISEYLIETLPGWHVEEFLESSSSYAFFQNRENELLPFWDSTEVESHSDKMGFWVPQVHQTQDDQNGQQLKELTSNNSRSARKRKEDNCFAVPQISPSPGVSYRSRIL